MAHRAAGPSLRACRTRDPEIGVDAMKTLAYLLGARALDLAHEPPPAPRRDSEPDLPPIASTPETAAAWRRWAEDGVAVDAPAADRKRIPVTIRTAGGQA